VINFQERPSERRHFVHKRIARKALSIAAGFIPGGSTALAIGRSLVGGRRGTVIQRAPALRNLGLTEGRRREITRAMQAATARGDTFTAGRFLLELGTQGALGPRMIAAPRPPSVPPVNPVRLAVIQAKPTPPIRLPIARERIPTVLAGATTMLHRGIVASLPCIPGIQKRDPITGKCVSAFIGTLPGIDDPTTRMEVGEAVMGRFGAAYMPGSKIVDRAICLPGDVVGADGLCYPKRSLRNSERAWPKGRRPLLTGGEMRAISVASRAANRVTRTAVRLQEMGLIQKPVARKPRKKAK